MSTVRITERDLAVIGEVLRWGGLPLTQLAAWYFDAERTAANRVTRLKQAGYLAAAREGRHVVVVATRAAARLRPDLSFTLRDKPWQSVDHLLAVVRVAARLLDEDQDATWITERDLRKAQASAPRGVTGRLRAGLGRRPDGVLVLSSGKWIAVEVELHRKRRLVYERIMSWYLGQTGTFAGVHWYVQGAALARDLTAVVAEYAMQDIVMVRELPRAARKRRAGPYG